MNFDKPSIISSIPSISSPLTILVIHGDPSKPNRILPGGKWDDDDWESHDKLVLALSSIKKYKFIYYYDHDGLIDKLRDGYKNKEFDLVFQLCDEGWNNDSKMELHITALLEMLYIPFTGTGSHSMGLSYDKDVVLQIAQSVGCPIPRSKRFAAGVDDDIIAKTHNLKYPVLIKPNETDGSLGITKDSICYDENQILNALKMIKEVFKLHCSILVQEYLDGKDITFAYLGNKKSNDIRIFPIIEEDYSDIPADLPRILGFESKWIPESPYWNIKSIPANITDENKKIIIDNSIAVATRLGYCDYVRFDWRCDKDGNPKLLEVNPNCGHCWDGHLNKIANLDGLTYSELLESILDVAVKRYSSFVRQEPADIDALMKMK